MTYGPFHDLRCRDDVAATLLDHADDEHRPSPSAHPDTDDPASTAPDVGDPRAPSFLSDDETDTTVMTGPAASSDG